MVISGEMGEGAYRIQGEGVQTFGCKVGSRMYLLYNMRNIADILQ